MRVVIATGLLLVAFILIAKPTSAQMLKADPKEPAKEEIKWPDKVMGKSLDQWVTLMRSSPDASTRDQAIRTLPLFGPACQKAATVALINAIAKDPDVNVRLTAINTVPLIGFEEGYIDQGFGALIAILDPAANAANHTRFEVTNALGNCGPIAKKAIPTLIRFTLVDRTSWQNRKAAAAALGRLGQPMTADDGPDIQAIRGLIIAMRQDFSHQVRREAVNALLALGPPKVEAAWKELRAALVSTIAMDADKSTALWARVAYARTEQDLLKATDPNLVAITKLVASKDLEVKQEAIQALGVIGEEAKTRLPELIAIVESTSEEPYIKATAIWAMSQIPSETGKILPVIDPLQRALDPGLKSAAETAYKALTAKPDPDKKKDPPPKK